MAFPTIPTVAASRVLWTNQADTTATRTFPNLSSLTKNSGDLLIAIVVGYQTTGSPAFSSWGGGFTGFLNVTSASQMCIGAAYKWSTGSETGTFTVTQAATITGHASLMLLSIPGAHASSPPEATAMAVGTTAAADPAALAPSWGAADTLWTSLVASGMTSGTGSWTGTGSTPPTNYGSWADSNTTDSSTVGQSEVAVSFRQLNTSSENVGTASGVDLSNARNVAVVFAVRPDPSQSVSVSGLASAASFGAVAYTTGNVNVPVSGLASEASFGTVTASTSGAGQNVDMTGLGLASEASLGAVTAVPGAVSATMTGLASAQSFGAPTLVPGAVSATPAGLASEQAFGSIAYTTGNVDVPVAGLSSSSAFGSASVSGGTTVNPAGLGSAQSHGTVTILVGGVTIAVSGLASSSSFATPGTSGGEEPTFNPAVMQAPMRRG